MPLNKPGVRTAVEPKTFHESYILCMNIHAHQMGADDFIHIEYCPFDQATGDRLIADRRELRLPFWETVALIPEAAQAFMAVANAVPTLINHYEAKRAAMMVPPPYMPLYITPPPAPPTQPEPTPEPTPAPPTQPEPEPEPEVVSSQKMKSRK